MSRAFVVGDVHGCLAELEALLAKAGFARGDRLFLVGDLVAKGPDSQGVVQLCRERGARAVLGNHDARLLAVRDASEPVKPSLRALAASMTQRDWRYLEGLPLTLDLPEFDALLVHGGLVPGVPLEAQSRDLLLTLRSLDAKGAPSTRVEGGVPWASRWPGPRHVYFGHDAVRGLQRHPRATGLDTGCVYGKRLTGVWLPEGELVQVAALKTWKAPDGP